MQILTIAGNVGKDAELRQAGGDDVLNFSLAVDNGKDKNGQKREATWYDCAIWGKRATSLQSHITKGGKLTLSGKPTVRVHEGKAYLGLTVNDLTFMGGGNRDDDAPRQDTARQAPQGRGPSLDDEIPFNAEWR